MLNAPTHLTIRRPSPTTISFTASNAPLRTSLSAHIVFYITILLRVLLGLSVLLIASTKLTDLSQVQGARAHETVYGGDRINYLAAFIAQKSSWRVLIPTTLGIIDIIFRKTYTGTPPRPLSRLQYHNLRSQYHRLLIHPAQYNSTNPFNHRPDSNTTIEESLLVLRGLGIQTCTSSPTYLSTSTTRFIPTDQIQDIFIHEAFKGFEVRFYLAVIVEGDGEVVVVFPVSLSAALRSLSFVQGIEGRWRG